MGYQKCTSAIAPVLPIVALRDTPMYDMTQWLAENLKRLVNGWATTIDSSALTRKKKSRKLPYMNGTWQNGAGVARLPSKQASARLPSSITTRRRTVGS